MSGWPTHPVDSREEQEQMTYEESLICMDCIIFSGVAKRDPPWHPPNFWAFSTTDFRIGTKSGQNDGEHLRESFMNRSKIQMVQKSMVNINRNQDSWQLSIT